MAEQPLFGLVPAGQPLVTIPTEVPSPGFFIYSIPPTKDFNFVAAFLLPGAALPPGTAAAIYLITPPAPGQLEPNSRFLSGLGPGKESAIFSMKSAAAAAAAAASSPTGQQSGGNIVIGIRIEEAGSVAARVEEAMQQKLQKRQSASGGQAAADGALVLANQQPSTLVLAQRIIRNAFNFLAGFSGQAGQVEVVPLRAFEEWWRKFESRVRADPGFLERDDGGV